MKKILVISYFYPPHGGSGVQRTLKFVKYLNRFDWDPIVITVKDSTKSYFVYDGSLLSDHPVEVPLIKIESPEVVLQNFLKILGVFKLKRAGELLLNAFLVPDRQILWVLSVLFKVGPIIKNNRIEVIYSSAPPQSVNLLGIIIKKLYKVKWVADYRDPWTHNAFYAPKFRYRNYINKKLEALAHQKADRIIANTSGNRKKLIRDFDISPHKVSVLTNGFDEQDFIGEQPTGFNNGKFNVVYTGTFLPGYSPEGVFHSMKELCSEFLYFQKDIKLHIAGPMEAHMKALVLSEIQKLGLGDNVICYGYLSHRDCIKLVLNADLLLLILWAGRGSENCIPAKFYEYLRSEKPVFAVVPKEGECAGMLKNYGIGFTATPDQPEEIKKGLYEAYSMWKENRLPQLNGNQNAMELQHFSREALTKRLADLFNQTLSGSHL